MGIRVIMPKKRIVGLPIGRGMSEGPLRTAME